MNDRQTIDALRIEVRENHIAEDLAVMFSESKRTEDVVSIRTYRGKLVLQGTKMDEILWLKAWKALEAAGIGTIEYDPHRRPLRLVNVRVTLKSLGEAIFGKRETLETPRFGQGAGRKMQVPTADRVVPKATQRVQPPAVSMPPQRRATDGIGPSTIGGRGRMQVLPNGTVSLELPDNLSVDDLATLMNKFRSLTPSEG